jgi:hypothetical protein
MKVKEYVKKFAEKRKNVFRSDIGFSFLSGSLVTAARRALR